MTENIRQAKIHVYSENYEIALRFLDKELEQNDGYHSEIVETN